MRFSARLLWTLTLLATLWGCKKGAEPLRISLAAEGWEKEAETLPDGGNLPVL